MAEIDTDAECRTERVVDLDGADMLAFILDHGVRVEIGKIGLPLEPEPMPAGGNVTQIRKETGGHR